MYMYFTIKYIPPKLHVIPFQTLDSFGDRVRVFGLQYIFIFDQELICASLSLNTLPFLQETRESSIDHEYYNF